MRWAIPIILFASSTAAAEPLSLDGLARLNRAELEALYRGAEPGALPSGFLRGRAIFPDGPMASVRGRAAGVLWRGKTFDPIGGELVNRWLFGLDAVKASVGSGESWLDGGPSHVMDYQGKSRFIWSDVRDEVREVAPGLYLGLMYPRNYRKSGYKMFFALEAKR